MARVKQTPKVLQKHAHSLLKKSKEAVKQASKDGMLVRTGKLKVPFKPASANGIGKVKKGLVKLIKRRWRSGTVAKREIRKLSRTTHHLFPKRPFQRLVRELAGDIKSDIRFAKESMHAIQECAEFFVCSMFMKSDIARNFAGRKTLLPKDVQFATFMRDECIWQFPPGTSASSASAATTKALSAAAAPGNKALPSSSRSGKKGGVSARTISGVEVAASKSGSKKASDKKTDPSSSLQSTEAVASSAASAAQDQTATTDQQQQQQQKAVAGTDQPPLPVGVAPAAAGAAKDRKRKAEGDDTSSSSAGVPTKKSKRDNTPSDSDSSSGSEDEESDDDEEPEKNMDSAAASTKDKKAKA